MPFSDSSADLDAGVARRSRKGLLVLLAASLVCLIPFWLLVNSAYGRDSGHQARLLLYALFCALLCFLLGILAVLIAFRRRFQPLFLLPLLLGLGHLGLWAYLAAQILGGGSEGSPCAARLSSVGLGIALYAKDHAGQLPQSLQQLIESDLVDPAALVCPRDSSRPGQGSSGSQPAATMPVSLVYVRPADTIDRLRADDVLVYEPVHLHGSGSFVLFARGAVRWLTPEQLQQALADTQFRAAQFPGSTQPASRRSP